MTRPSSTELTRRTLLRAALVLPASIVLAACGDSPASSPTQPAAPAQPTQAATPITAAQPTVPAGAISQPTTAKPAAPAAPTTAATPAPIQAQAATTKLNLNTATREQFLAVPNVGDRMVREFLEYRPYRSIQQFRREIGKYVSQEQVAAYEQYVFVPVAPNDADAETLRQLPGVDATIASQLVASRPYASADAFLTKLGQYLPADQVAVARTYLAAS